MKEDLRIPNRLTSRDPLALYMAKWFDEPFQADVINMMTRYRCVQTSEEIDRHCHADFCINSKDSGEDVYVDAKMITKNFSWTDANTMKTHYINSLTVAEYALNSNTSYFSFIWRGCLYLVSHQMLKEVSPELIRASNGQNNHRQVLYHYDVSRVISSLFGLDCYLLNDSLSTVYDDAYSAYERARAMVYELHYPKTQSERIYYDSIRMRTLETFRNELLPIIKNYNSLMNKMNMCQLDIKGNSFDDELKDILCSI